MTQDNSIQTAHRRKWRVFEPILAGASVRDRLLACIGTLAGIVLTSFACLLVREQALALALIAPIGASAVLLFAVPASPLAQPWPIVGGNTVSAFVGMGVAHLGLPPIFAAGLAVSAAIFAMSLARCLHPPGGAVALTAVLGGPAVLAAGSWFPLMPVAVNSLTLVVTGWLYHRFSGHSYPHKPVAIAGHAVPVSSLLAHRAELNAALEDLGETFDVSRDDLELLFQRMEYHATRNAVTAR